MFQRAQSIPANEPAFSERRMAYYARWIHEPPIIVTPERDRELRKLQQVLYACATRFAQVWRDWLHVVPHTDAVLETLEYCERYPYEAGTFRPDFLMCADGSLRACEITSRFFGNGYFFSYFYAEAGLRKAHEAGASRLVSYMDGMFGHFRRMAQGKRRLVVLKSADPSDSIRLYVPFYEACGLTATILEAKDIERNLRLLDEDALVVSALNQADLAKLTPATRRLMADVGCKNDFRTIYLLHDKRFFRLFFEDAFTSACLSAEDAAFLREHAVETYLPTLDPEVFDYARGHKDGFIIKNHWLGKSEQVLAGCLATQDAWEACFAPEAIGDMVLQPFHEPRSFELSWEGRAITDYVCGTLLALDDGYYGPGVIRASNSRVINQGDDRKFSFAITDELDRFDTRFVM